MHSLPIVLAMIFAATMGLSLARADDTPSIPANAWESHPEGIALAVMLTSRMDHGTKKYSILVYTKNTSQASIYYQGPDGFHLEMEIFYYDHDKPIPLRDYSPESGSRIIPPEIQPGETLLRKVDLNPDELALIQAHPVKCRAIIADRTFRNVAVDSSPKILIAVP